MNSETERPNGHTPANTKTSYLKDAGFYLILWGLLVIIYCLLVYNATSQGGKVQTWYYSLFAIGGVVSLLYSKRKGNAPAQASPAEKLYGYTWSVVAVALVAIWLSASVFSPKMLMPLTMLLYGIASLITGGYTRYWPSVLGGIVCLICAFFSFGADFPTQHLLAAAAVFFAHVLPGILMRR